MAPSDGEGEGHVTSGSLSKGLKKLKAAFQKLKSKRWKDKAGECSTWHDVPTAPPNQRIFVQRSSYCFELLVQQLEGRARVHPLAQRRDQIGSPLPKTALLWLSLPKTIRKKRRPDVSEMMPQPQFASSLLARLWMLQRMRLREPGAPRKVNKSRTGGSPGTVELACIPMRQQAAQPGSPLGAACCACRLQTCRCAQCTDPHS